MKESGTNWAFSRTGEVDQVLIRNASDIARLGELDPKLWAVLAMPTNQSELKETLAQLDYDHDASIRIPEILKAISYLQEKLLNLDILFDRNASLHADQVKDTGIQHAIAKIVEGIGPAATHAESAVSGPTSSTPVVDLPAVESAIASFSALPFNGDGSIGPEAAEDDESRSFITKLLESGYAIQLPNGRTEIDSSLLGQFKADANAILDWLKRGTPTIASILTEDVRTEALAWFRDIRNPIEDYFERCGILALSDDQSILSKLRELIASELSRNYPDRSSNPDGIPLAMPNPESVLDISAPLNPAYQKKVRDFFALVKVRLADPDKVTANEWQKISSEMVDLEAWKSEQPLNKASSLNREFLEKSLSSQIVESIAVLIERDLNEKEYSLQLAELRTLMLIKRDFLKILGNFVNLDEFYIKKHGIFQSGRLFLDGRELDFCMDVNNPGAHSTMAGLSSMYLIYCDLVRKGGEKKSIVAALTAGGADNIFPGRNGIYFDAAGNDWNAVITKVVVQPISIREAFFRPYKWFVKTLEDMAMKRAANAEASSLAKVKGAAQETASIGKPEEKPGAQIPKKIDVGTVAAIGVALGSIGAMVTGILGMFFGLGAWMPLGLVGVVAAISGPSMVLAYLKLRKRNIGPLLNAEGWAVNGQLKINVPFGATLSRMAVLPPGSSRQFKDPFAEKRRPWWLYLTILFAVMVVVAYFLGWLAPLLGGGK